MISQVFLLSLVLLVAGHAHAQKASLADGHYSNPILAGDYPDPSVFRDGDDYYMTHSSFEYYPGLLIWHSTDLVNWTPIGHALRTNVGSVWAPEFLKHKDTYYIYFPASGVNWVITAPSPKGPWSEPIRLDVGHIDPGHVVGRDGKRYLHFSGGHVVALSVPKRDCALNAIHFLCPMTSRARNSVCSGASTSRTIRHVCTWETANSDSKHKGTIPATARPFSSFHATSPTS